MSAHAKNRVDCRLGRGRRLSKPVLFSEAYEQGNRQSGRFMTMWVRQGTGAALRLGVVASKRTERLAVRRNKAKRKLREVFRRNRPGLEAGNVDLVLVAKKRAADACLKDLNNDFLQLAERAELIGHEKKL